MSLNETAISFNEHYMQLKKRNHFKCQEVVSNPLTQPQSSHFVTRWKRLALGCAIFSLACSAWAQNSAVEPEKRGGGSYQRHLALMERVVENAGPIDILFVGDSITQAWENSGKNVWQNYYASNGRKSVNIGISGDRTQHVLWRLNEGAVKGLEPKVAVVMIGTNNSGGDRNSASEMVEGVRAVVTRLHELLPETKILLLGIFPRGEEFNEIRGKILQVNQAVQKMEDEMDGTVFYLDIGHKFLQSDGRISTEIMPDFLHLTEAGYVIWAQSIEPTLVTLLSGEDAEASNGAAESTSAPVVAAAPEKDPFDPAGDWRWFIRGPEDQLVEFLMHLETSTENSAVNGYFLMSNDQGERKLEIMDGSRDGRNIRMTAQRKRETGEVMKYTMEGEINEVNDAMEGVAKAMFNGAEVVIPWNASRK